MLIHLKSWFRQHFTQVDDQKSIELELAIAVLFYQIIRADDALHPEEEAQFRASLTTRQPLMSPAQLDELIQRAIIEAEQAADFHQFTRVIVEHCGASQRMDILKQLWQLAYADQSLDPDEEHIIRKICDLLYLSHTQFIQAKLQVKEG